MLVIQPGKLGDVLCTTAMVRALAQDPRVTEVHVLCIARTHEALRDNPHVARVFAFDTLNRWALLRTFRRQRYGAVIGCMPTSFTGMVGLWSLAPRRLNTSSVHHGLIVRALVWVNTVNLPYHIRTSTHAHYMALLAAMGTAPVPYGIDITVPPAAAALVDRWLQAESLTPGRFVCLAPLTGNPVKQWPLPKFATLINTIVAHGLKVVILTQDPAAAAELRLLAADATGVHIAAGLSLAEVGALCTKAALFVSADTGPMYIAYGVGCPLAILIGPIAPEEQVPPPGPRVRHILPPAGSEPWVFVSRTPRTGTPDKLRSIRETSEADAWAAVEGLLAQSASSAA